ncbi:taurine catabolism dioxygenase [Nemania serpens]|nr:taurine catabolism dioxygenase [Nemania serpens]
MPPVVKTGTPYPEPLQLTGALDNFSFEDITPATGREYPTVNVVDDIINAQNPDELIRDLGITIAQRGVVFFRAQHNLTDDVQKHLIQRLGELTGKPAESGLHIHPILNDKSEFGVGDRHISTIDSVHRKKLYSNDPVANKRSQQWHSDIQFEQVPPDFSSLRLTKLPSNGGDTLWVSGYGLYDSFSKPYQKFLEGLTATFQALGVLFNDESIFQGPRGHPKNIGKDFSAVHPVIRTNPVTGWKSLYGAAAFPKHINELTDKESREIIKINSEAITENHDQHARFKWRNENDIAIWDNRCTFHTATHDYDGLGERAGHRAVGIAEVPYLDPNSQSRSEALRKTQ